MSHCDATATPCCESAMRRQICMSVMITQASAKTLHTRTTARFTTQPHLTRCALSSMQCLLHLQAPASTCKPSLTQSMRHVYSWLVNVVEIVCGAGCRCRATWLMHACVCMVPHVTRQVSCPLATLADHDTALADHEIAFSRPLLVSRYTFRTVAMPDLLHVTSTIPINACLSVAYYRSIT